MSSSVRNDGSGPSTHAAAAKPSSAKTFACLSERCTKDCNSSSTPSKTILVIDALPNMLAYAVRVLNAPRVSFNLYFKTLSDSKESFVANEETRREARKFWEQKCTELEKYVAGEGATVYPTIIDRLRKYPKEEAKLLKEAGNAYFRKQKFHIANALYSLCIGLDEDVAVYWSNRAAVEIQLMLFESAVVDCMNAVGRDPTFLRAKVRLAKAFRCLGNTNMEIQALKGAIQIAPGNAELKKQLRKAEERKAKVESGTAKGDEMTEKMVQLIEGMVEGGPDLFYAHVRKIGQETGMDINVDAMEQIYESGEMRKLLDIAKTNPDQLKQMMQIMRKNPGMEFEAMSEKFGPASKFQAEPNNEGTRAGPWRFTWLNTCE